jgi:hypothetical protein
MAGEPVRAGSLVYQLERGLDVLPVEARVVVKRPLANPDPATLAAYQALYASFAEAGASPNISLYETVDLDNAPGLDLGAAAESTDGLLWVALLARKTDADNPTAVRAALAGRACTLGLVLAPREGLAHTLAPGEGESRQSPVISVDMPGSDALTAQRQPVWQRLVSRVSGDGQQSPLLLEVDLPAADRILDFADVDPLEAGAGGLPPGFEDSALAARVVTWLRIGFAPGSQPRLLWAGAHCAPVIQAETVTGELLGLGNGGPDQRFKLKRGPVVEGSLKLRLRTDRQVQDWRQTDELYAAGPEVPVVDPRLPGLTRGDPADSRVYALDAEAGEVRFGDGLRGARPPAGASIEVDYQVTAGRAGNVSQGAIKTAPTLPAGLTVGNPLPTWGGTDAEAVADAEKRIPAWLRHRDRAVTAQDFRDLALATPNAALARAEVLTAWLPPAAGAAPGEPGSVPGAVTIMLVPSTDPDHPAAPRPGAALIADVGAWLDARRLITTQVCVTGPRYLGIWLTVAVRPAPDVAMAEVTRRVEEALTAFLSPLPLPGADGPAPPRPGGIEDITPGGWPLNVPLLDKQLLAVVARVPGVLLVSDLALGLDTAGGVSQLASIPLAGLELPEVLGIQVTEGDTAPSLVELKASRAGWVDSAGGVGDGALPARLPVPFIPDKC